MGFFLGIDLGTSYFKAGIFDIHGNLVGLGRCIVSKQTGNGTICELPIVEFWTTLRQSVSEALNNAKINANEIESVSYSSQANSFVLLDKLDNPLTPLILWPDERVKEMPDALKTLIGRADFQEKTGIGILPGIQSLAAKICWFQQNQSNIWTQVKSVMSISDYLTFALTDKKISDFSTASMTGLFNVPERKWWDVALEKLDIDKSLLSFPAKVGSYVGLLTEKGANQLGLIAGTKYFLGGLDHHIVALGAGLLTSNNISESTGTVLACVNHKVIYSPKNKINVAPGMDENHYFQMSFNENGATALEWYLKNYAPEFSIEELLEMAENIEPGCNGLVANPCVDKYEGLTGFENIKETHTHAHFVRAILESTSKSLRELVHDLDEAREAETIISSGGGARSFLWTQIKADILNKTFIIPDSSEVACQGAAMIGAMAISKNIFEKKREILGKVINPNPLNVGKYKN